MKFDSYHPIINLIYFLVAIVTAIMFDHPVFLGIALAVSFAYSVKLNGMRGLVFNIIFALLPPCYAIYYSYYNHFGITNLGQNIIGNEITLEALVWGFVIGLSAFIVVMWFSCLFAVFTSDKFIYLFGKVSPKLSLFLSILLRMIPSVKKKWRAIAIAQSGIGRGPGQGNFFRRMLNRCRMVSMIITWLLENFILTTQSMKSRGYTLRGRTAFAVYRFDNRDRGVVIFMFIGITVILMAILLDQTNIQYNPEIIFNKITAVSYVFYLCYLAFLIAPIMLQLAYERKFSKLEMNFKK
ncbi:MAG: energy-coupling factor transporter transmembrane component T [Clostridiales bacterium]|nr:energy-coupling factor transporter transmembrane component T [Clostridiales bacterium]MDY4060849.1 energy-coupling factor transporter transmembrane component T [Anaerovoracaceae bacterium]